MATTKRRTRKPKTQSKTLTNATPTIEGTLGSFYKSEYAPETIPRVHPMQLAKRVHRWVHRCLAINSQAAAAVPLRLFTVGNKDLVQKATRLGPRPLDKRTKAYLQGKMDVQVSAAVRKRLQGNIDDLTEITNHDALMLLDDVNPWQEGFSFRESWYQDLQTFGRLFNQIVTRDGRPDELWRMMPQFTDVVPDARDFVKEFLFGKHEPRKRFKPEDVFWVKAFDTGNEWGGMGWVEAWWRTIDADFTMIEFNNWLFARGGTPDLVLISSAGWSQDQKVAFRKDWRRLFGAMASREENIAMLGGGGDTKLEKLSQTPREMEYTASMNQMRDDICSAAGVPKSLMTTDDVNRANAREGHPNHIRYTIWPMVLKIEEAINQRLLPKWSDRLFLIHDNPLKEDSAIRIQQREANLRSGSSINEERLKDGEEPLDKPEADEPLIAQDLIPLSMLGMNAFASLLPAGGLAAEPSVNAETADDGTSQPPADLTQPPQGEQERLPKTEEGQIETTEALVLNGAQIQAARDIVLAVTAGELLRDSGIGMLEVLFNLTTEQAERIMGPAGTPTPTQANPNPAKEAEEEREAQRFEAEMQAMNEPPDDGPPAKSHKAMLFKLWSTEEDAETKAAQDDLPKTGAVVGFTTGVSRTMQLQAAAAMDAMSGAVGAQEAAQVAESVLAQQRWIDELAKVTRPFVEEAIAIGGNRGLEKVGIDLAFDVTNPQVQAFVDNYTVRLSTAVNDYTRVSARELLGEGLKNGESVAELTARIRPWAEANPDVASAGSPAYRAERIARTESARAYVEGERVAYKGEGFTKKQWLLAPGACPICEMMAHIFNKDGGIGIDTTVQDLVGNNLAVKGQVINLDYAPIQGPPGHPNCLLPSTGVSARGLVAAMRANYDGPAVRITMSDGTTLSVTSQHKLCTPLGFVVADDLNVGDNLICTVRRDGVISAHPDDNERPTPVADVFTSLAKSSRVPPVGVPLAPEYLHGDGRFCNGDIDVVTTNRLLRPTGNPALLKKFNQLPLCWGWGNDTLSRLGDLDSMLVGLSFAAYSGMAGIGEARPLCSTRLAHTDVHGLAAVALSKSSTGEIVGEGLSGNVQLISESLDRYAGFVTTERIVNIERFDYTGHVYDLQTESGLYFGNTILSSNCRCDLIAVE